MLLRRILGVTEFVNADVIAEGLSAYNPNSMAIPAARLLLERIKDLSRDRQTFAQAVSRVRLRVSRGGHYVPEEVVRRRFRAGIADFLDLYAPLADRWWVFDGGRVGAPELLSEKVGGLERILLPARWNAFLESRHD